MLDKKSKQPWAIELLHPKKVGTLPVEGKEEVKRTNEIKMAIPVLETIDIEGKDITADVLLTQRALAEYLVSERKAHYLFTVKGNQPRLLDDIQLFFQDRDPDKPALRAAIAQGQAWTHRNPEDLDHHGTERPPRLSSRRQSPASQTGFTAPAHCALLWDCTEIWRRTSHDRKMLVAVRDGATMADHKDHSATG